MSNGGIFMMTVMEAMCGHNSMDSAQVWASYCCCLKSSLEETHTNTALMIWHSFEGKHTKHLLHSLGSKFTTLDPYYLTCIRYWSWLEFINTLIIRFPSMPVGPQISNYQCLLEALQNGWPIEVGSNTIFHWTRAHFHEGNLVLVLWL
jgi:hypothetical protein